MNRQEIEARLASEMGLDVGSLGAEALDRAVRARTKALGLKAGCWEEYGERVENHRGEWDEFIECLVVPETWFLRDKAAFDELRKTARAWWSSAPTEGKFRVLSLPCATGEEAYSIAISLLDEGLPADRVEIVGIDLSRRNLEVAARALYRSRAVKEVPKSLLEKYGRAEGQGVELRERVRGMVEFRQGNAVSPTIAAGLGVFQVVFCRNMLIYLTPEARERVVASVDRLLATGGLLLVGHAERLRLLDQKFEPILGKGLFAYTKGPTPRARAAAPIVVPPPRPAAASTAPARRPAPSSLQAPPVPLIPAAPMRPAAPEPVAPSALDRARELADRMDYRGAASLCEAELKRSEADVELIHLLAVVRQALGEQAEAERLLRRAIYLDPGHVEALLALSLIAGRRGDRAEAERLRKRAERADSREGQQ